MATDSHPAFVPVGYVGRVHGLDGELKLIWDIDNPRLILEQENPVVFFKNNRGDFYPVRVSTFRVEKKKKLTNVLCYF
jgi:ribosomal 30S subunit maturation factor RimM